MNIEVKDIKLLKKWMKKREVEHFSVITTEGQYFGVGMPWELTVGHLHSHGIALQLEREKGKNTDWTEQE